MLDCDSTLIQDEVIELLADEAGARESVAAVTERAMRGELDFAESLRERVATLAGLNTAVFEKVFARIRPSLGVRALIETVHQHGGVVGVVSGGFHELLDPLAVELKLDLWRANRLELDGDTLTGRPEGPIVDAQAKADALREWASDLGLPLTRTIAVGDGANDLAMMDEAGLSIAFNAKPRVRERADVAIDLPDLSQILPLLGLRG